MHFNEDRDMKSLEEIEKAQLDECYLVMYTIKQR